MDDDQRQTSQKLLKLSHLPISPCTPTLCSLVPFNLDQERHSQTQIPGLANATELLPHESLLAWNLQTDPSCLLCNQANESRDHIYFACPFSVDVSNHFSSRFAITSSSSSWDDIAYSLLSQSTSSNHKYLSILTWQAVIYNLWWERNERLHRSNHRSADQIISKTSAIIKNRIFALRSDNNSLASDLMQYWFSLFSIL